MKKLSILVCCVSAILCSGAAGLAMPKSNAPSGAAAGHAGTTTGVISGEALSGKVVQSMSSGGYTYVQLERKGGDKVWVAVSETPIKVGSTVSFQPGMEMKNFESKTLKRTFDSVIFSNGINAPADATKGANTAESHGSPGSKGAASAKEAKISVAKAKGANAYTVAEVFAKSAKLNNKKVVIRGKVVKVSSGIMGKNWIHIQDGTGSEAKKTHNLVCTSADSAAVGDIITVTGDLRKDKDFGAGYKYSALVENAKIKK